MAFCGTLVWMEKGYVEEAKFSGRKIGFSLSIHWISRFCYCLAFFCHGTYKSASKPFPFFPFLVPYSYDSNALIAHCFPIKWLTFTMHVSIFDLFRTHTKIHPKLYFHNIRMTRISRVNFWLIYIALSNSHRAKNVVANFMHLVHKTNYCICENEWWWEPKRVHGFKNALRSIVECWTQLKTVYPYIKAYAYV